MRGVSLYATCQGHDLGHLYENYEVPCRSKLGALKERAVDDGDGRGLRADRSLLERLVTFKVERGGSVPTVAAWTERVE